MIIGIIFAHVWGVLELLVVSTVTRTIRARTVLTGIAAGLYGCSLAALTAQMAWTKATAWIVGRDLYQIVEVDSYTLGPIVEEAFKVLPVAVLIWLIPKLRRQWSHTDCVLLGAALGSGFGLAEDLFRYAGAVSRSVAVSGGWEIFAAFSSRNVPSLTSSLVSWLPSATIADDAVSLALKYNVHLIWSSFGGLAVSLVLFHRERLFRGAGLAIFLYSVLDHAAVNYALQGNTGVFASLALALERFGSFMWFGPIAALSLASWLDLSRCRSCPGRVRELTLNLRHHIDRGIAGSVRAAIVLAKSIGLAILKIWSRRDALLWTVLVLPSALWLGLGGFPETVWLQKLLTAGPVWVVIRGIACLSLVYIAWQVVRGVVGGRRSEASSLGCVTADLGLRSFAGTGAICFGTYALFLAFSGHRPNDVLITNAHVLEAAASSTVIATIAIALAVLMLFPPAAVAVDGLVGIAAAELFGGSAPGLSLEAAVGPLATDLEIASFETVSSGETSAFVGGENFNGQPVFDSLHDERLPADLVGPTVSDERQMRAATEALKAYLRENPQDWNNFTSEQRVALRTAFGDMETEGVASPRIQGFTWHHNDMDEGVLQLVDRAEHAAHGHFGGAAEGWVKR
jgi:hypothetical protein